MTASTPTLSPAPYVIHLTTDELRGLIAEALAGSDSHVLTTKTAAELLQVSTETVSRWAGAGVIPGAKLDGIWRFTRRSLLAHIEGRNGAVSS